MSVAEGGLLTTEQLLAQPEDGMELELDRGRAVGIPMTKRNRRHSRSEARIAHALHTWLDSRPEGAGEVVGGEAGFRLCRDPDTTVGIDVAYVGPEVAGIDPESAFFEGAPILAVEILSPSDTQEWIDRKVEVYLRHGVGIIWVVNPRFRTIQVYRPDAEPALFNGGQVIDAEPHLPGFRALVSSLI